MPRLSRRNLVVALLFREGKAISLDLLARVRVLEGVAGVKPGIWMRNGVPDKGIVDVFRMEVKTTGASTKTTTSRRGVPTTRTRLGRA